jgi:hypothetical protein
VATLICPNVLQVVPRGHDPDRNFANVLHFAVTRSPAGADFTLAQLMAIQVGLEPTWQVFYDSYAPNDTIFDGVDVVDINSATGQKVVATNRNHHATNGNAIGYNTSLLFSLPVALRYRGGHGRTYIGPLSINATVDGSTVVPGEYAAVQAAWNAMIGGFLAQMNTVGSGAFFGVLRGRKPPAVPHIVPLSGVAILSTQLASQRRRLRRVAHH